MRGSKWPTGQQNVCHGHKNSWLYPYTCQVEVGKVIFDYLDSFFRNWPETNKELGFFGIENYKIIFFLNFFITKTSNFILHLNDDFYVDSFEVYIIFLGQKLMIFEFRRTFFSFWPRSLLKPPQAKLWASVTSWRSQLDFWF